MVAGGRMGNSRRFFVRFSRVFADENDSVARNTVDVVYREEK